MRNTNYYRRTHVNPYKLCNSYLHIFDLNRPESFYCVSTENRFRNAWRITCQLSTMRYSIVTNGTRWFSLYMALTLVSKSISKCLKLRFSTSRIAKNQQTMLNQHKLKITNESPETKQCFERLGEWHLLDPWTPVISRSNSKSRQKPSKLPKFFKKCRIYICVCFTNQKICPQVYCT